MKKSTYHNVLVNNEVIDFINSHLHNTDCKIKIISDTTNKYLYPIQCLNEPNLHSLDSSKNGPLYIGMSPNSTAQIHIGKSEKVKIFSQCFVNLKAVLVGDVIHIRISDNYNPKI